MLYQVKPTNGRWEAVASSSDGVYLMAAVYKGCIFSSSDSGREWLQRTGSGSRLWKALTSSSDGSFTAAVATGEYIITSSDYGATWLERTSSSRGQWTAIAFPAPDDPIC